MKKNKHKNSTVAIAALMGMTTAIAPAFPTVYAQGMNEQNPAEDQDLAKAPQTEGNLSQENTISKDAQPIEETKEQAVANTLEATTPTDTQDTTSGVAIDDTNFPDPVFRQWVMDNADTVDANGKKDGILTPEEIEKVWQISIDQEKVADTDKIKDLKGIEHFTDLLELKVINTNIESLKLTNKILRKVEVNHNQLKTLDLSALSILEKLECAWNKDLNKLSVKDESKLKTLNISYTSLPFFDFSLYTNLTNLNVSGLKLTSLNVSNNFALNVLDCQNNPDLNTLDLSKNKNISSLYISETSLSEFDGSDNPKLSILSASNNQHMENINVKNNPNLLWLTAINCNLSTIDLSQNKGLTQLKLDGNKIQDIDVSANTSLQYFTISNNLLETLDISNNPEIYYLRLENNRLTGLDASNNIKLDLLGYSGNRFISLDLPKGVGTVDGLSSGELIQEVSIDLPSDYTYDLKDMYPNISADKLRNKILDNIENATLNGTILQVKDPSRKVVYSYACDDEKKFVLEVSLNLQAIYWTSDLNIESWIYGQDAKKPTITANKGTITYSYSEDGVNFTTPDKVLTHAGTFYVKAEATDPTYGTISTIEKFEISKAPITENEIPALPSNLTSVSGNTLSTISLGNGWTWKEPTQKVSVNNSGYEAYLTVVNDTNYDYSSIEGYSDTEHRVYRTLSVQVSKLTNNWTASLTVHDWMENETPVYPTAQAKYGTVSFLFSDAKDGTFTDKLPTTVGTWYVKAIVAGTADYEGLESDIASFTIKEAPTKAKNSWTSPLTVQDWTENETPIYPTAKAKYGTVSFLFSDAKDGTFTDTLPTTVGTWYVKAIVAGTADYEGLESDIASFTIKEAPKKAENSWTTPLTVQDWTENESPVYPTAQAKYGNVSFLYSDSKDGTFTDKLPTTVGTWYVKAVVAGTANYEGLESDIVSFTIKEAPKKAENSWVTPLAVQDWTENESPIYPTAKAKYGTVSFLYSDAKDGTFTDKLPTTVGTWYVKAVVAGTADYEGLESNIVSFIIKEAPKRETIVPKPEVKEETSPIMETGSAVYANPIKFLLVLLSGCLAFFKKKEQQE